MEYSIRIAHPLDVPSIVELVNSAYRGESSRKGWTTEADLLGGQRTDADTLATSLKKSASQILLLSDKAITEETLLACVYLQRQGDKAYLGMLTVAPEMQAAGIGRYLLTAAENWFREEWKSDGVEMNVLKQRQELIDWYIRRGYQRTDRSEPFHYGDERFGRPKVSNLEFVILEKHFNSAALDR